MSESLVPKENEWIVLKEQASVLVKSGFLPLPIKTPEQAIAIILKGKELGLPMMQSLSSVNIINGKPTMSAELMAALVFQKVPGAILNCIETTNTKATYEAQRPGGKLTKLSFTIEDAKLAGVLDKENWKKYPAAMLRARACSAICRIVFPDAIMGVYTPDELGALTNEEGEPITVQVVEQNQTAQDYAQEMIAPQGQTITDGQIATLRELKPKKSQIKDIIGRDITRLAELTYDEAEAILVKLMAKDETL